ncbi:MAG: beta strand repeat-containing protein, partial [Betaproteobacteria bacterium]
MTNPIIFNEFSMTDAQRKANAERRAKEIRRAHLKFRRKEIAVAAFSTFYALQSSAQTTRTTLPAANTVTVLKGTAGNGSGLGYTLLGSTGTVNLGQSSKAVVIWGEGLGIQSSQLLEFTNGTSAVVLNKITDGSRSSLAGSIAVIGGTSSVRSLVFVNPQGFSLTNLGVSSLVSNDIGLLFSTRDLGATGTLGNGSLPSAIDGMLPGTFVGNATLGFGAPASTTSNSANITVSGGLSSLSSPNNVVGFITDTGPVRVLASPLSAGSIFITTENGAVTTSGGTASINAGRALTISAGTGSVSISTSGAGSAPTVSISGGEVTVVHADTAAMTLGNITAGNLSLTADKGFLRDSTGTPSINATGSVSLITSAADRPVGTISEPLILTANTLNVTSDQPATYGAGSVNINYNNNLNLGNVRSSGDVSITPVSAGTLTQTGVITLTGANPTVAFGNTSTVNALTLTRSGLGGNLTISGGNITLAAGGVSNTAGNITIDATGALTGNSSGTAFNTNVLTLTGGLNTPSQLNTTINTLNAANVGQLQVTNSQALILSGASLGAGPSNSSIVTTTTGNLNVTSALAGQGNLTLTASNGTVILCGPVTRTAGGDLLIQGNAIEPPAGGFNVTVTNGNINLVAQTLNASGLITAPNGTTTLNVTGNGTLTVTGALTGNGALSLVTGSGSATGNVALNAAITRGATGSSTGNITIQSSSITSNVSGTVTATNGNIALLTDVLNLDLGGGVNAGNGTVRVQTLANATGINLSATGTGAGLNISQTTFDRLQSANAGTIVIGADGQVGNVTVVNALSTNATLVLNGGNVGIDANLNTGSKSLTINARSASGAIGGAGNVTSGALDVNTSNGNANLSAANQISGTVTANVGSGGFTLRNENATVTTLGDVRAGSLMLTASGNVAQAGSTTLNVTGTANVSAVGKDIALTESGNDFGTVVASGANVSIRDTNALEVGNVTATGAGGLTLNATSGLSTLTGSNITTTVLNVVTTNANAVLDGTNQISG